MQIIFFVIYLLAIWLVTFLLTLFPARSIGSWLARSNLPMPFGIIACIKVDLIFVVFMSTFYLWMRFPHANDQRFVYVFITITFGIPALTALIFGYIRARKNENVAGSGDFISWRIRV